MRWIIFLLLFFPLLFFISVLPGSFNESLNDGLFILGLISFLILTMYFWYTYYKNRDQYGYKWAAIYYGFKIAKLVCLFGGIWFLCLSIKTLYYGDFEYLESSGKGAIAAAIINSSYNTFGLMGPIIVEFLWSVLMFYALYLLYAKSPDKLLDLARMQKHK